MDYLTPFDLSQLKAFFSALKQSNFNLKQIPSSIVMAGERTPVNKPHCLDLLRTFPALAGKEFEDEGVLGKFLAKPDNVRRILGDLSVAERNELAKTIEEKPVAVGDDSAQTGGEQTSAEQPVGGANPGATGPATGMPGTPLSPASRSPRLVRQASSVMTKEELATQQAARREEFIKGIARKNEGEIAKGPTTTLSSTGQNAGVPRPGITKDEFSRKISMPSRGVPGQPHVPGGNIAANINSSSQIAAKKMSSRLGSGISNMFKGMGRAGGDMMSGAVGNGGRALGRVGLKGVDAGARFSKAFSNRGSFFSNAGRKGAGRWVGLGLLGLALLTGLLAAFAPPSEAPPVSAAPVSTGGDISSCKFTRANESASYKSPLLLSYINTASNLSGIPPAILAAFIRVESPGSVNMNDDQTKNYAASCPVSPTGALGIMQIQPPGTKSAAGDPASCDDCIDAGARLIGKTVATMTRQDYCDPSSGIIIASGWILKKMNNLGYQNTGKWNSAWTSDPRAINALVNTYYGCLQYGGTAECTGPYNYGTDVYTGAQSCNTAASPTASSGSRPAPPATDPAAIKQAIISKFGVTMNGFDNDHLQWTWEKLWNVSGTNFPKYISGVTITAGPGSEKLSCSSLRLEQYPQKELFQLVLTHEFGHFIQDCDKGLPRQLADQQNAFTQEGGVTFYATNAVTKCHSYSSLQEDYAEMVAYYLNPGVNVATAACTPLPFTAPDLKNNFPLHYNVVSTVLGPY